MPRTLPDHGFRVECSIVDSRQNCEGDKLDGIWTITAGMHVVCELDGMSDQVCPKCDNAQTRMLGQSPENPASVMRCDACGHVWMSDAAMAAAMDAARTCSKCGSVRIRSVGRSAAGVGYFRCDECEHLIIEPPAPATP